VLLAPPSIPELRDRLLGRRTEGPPDLEARMARAEIELAAADEFDEVIVNDDVQRAAGVLVKLIEGATG
jgi:guanylate kinase